MTGAGISKILKSNAKAISAIDVVSPTKPGLCLAKPASALRNCILVYLG